MAGTPTAPGLTHSFLQSLLSIALRPEQLAELDLSEPSGTQLRSYVDVVSAKPAGTTEDGTGSQEASRSTITLGIVNLLRSEFNNSNAKIRRKN